MLLKIFRKLGYDVGVDRVLHKTMITYFDIPKHLPVLEDVYCEEDLREIKKHMMDYQNTDKNLGNPYTPTSLI